MAGPPPLPPSAQRPLQLLAPACYNMMGMSAYNWASQYSRSNSEIIFSTPFPTCEVGYSWPYGSFGVEPYRYDCYHPQCVLSMSLSQCQAQIQKNRYDLLKLGTGVFHPTRESTEYRRASYNNIKERRTRQVVGREDNGNCRNERGENSSKEKNKNEGSAKKKEECHNSLLPLKNESRGKKKNKKNDSSTKKEEESHDPSLQHNNGSKGKKEKEKKIKKKNGGSEKKEEICYVPNLPPGIVLPMEWPYPDSF